MKRSHLWALTIAGVAILWVGSGWIFDGEESTQRVSSTRGANTEAQTEQQTDRRKQREQALAGGVKINDSVAQSVTRSILLYGATEPNRYVSIRPETEGRVIELLAKEGDVVKKGQPIVRLDLRNRDIRLKEAKARVEQRRIELEAAEKLFKKGFRPEVSLAQARTEWEQARAELAQAELDVANSTLRAPYEGILESLNVDIGDYVLSGIFVGEEGLAMIADNDPLIVNAQLPEKDIGSVQKGVPVEVMIGAEKKVTGTLRFIGSVASKETRTFRVEVIVPNPDYAIPAGMSAELRIPAQTEMGHKIPASALALNDDGQIGVKTLSPNRLVRFMPVRLIQESKEGIWVGGLPAEVKIITLGQAYLADGQMLPEMIAESPVTEPGEREPTQDNGSSGKEAGAQ